MDKAACNLIVGIQSGNCTSLPDSLNSINFGSSLNEGSPTKSDEHDAASSLSENKPVMMIANTNLNFMQGGKIPSIVIDSNENNNNNTSNETNRVGFAALPLVARRRSFSNKRATSLLVRFKDGEEKASKLEKIKMKILENKQQKTNDESSKNISNGSIIQNSPNKSFESNASTNNTPKNVARTNTTTTSSLKRKEEIDQSLYLPVEETILTIEQETPVKEKTNENQLIRSLTKPFSTIRRQANKSTRQSEKTQNSPKSPTTTTSPHAQQKPNDDETTTPVKQHSSSLRSKVHAYEMPCVSEEATNNIESKMALMKAISSSNLSVNQNSDPPPPPGQHQQQKSVNMLLDYLINSSKGGQLANTNNSKLDVANLAALAALCDLRESSGEDNNGGGGAGLNSVLDSASNELALKNLLIDLVSPPLVASSQFDLSSAGSSVEHLELQLNYKQHNDNSPQNGNLNACSNKPQIDSASFNLNFSSANGINSNKKQLNEQIMRACMGYLDYINKKHNRERRIQIIRNKVSGFVLLTIVFLLIFGLTLVMTFFLGRAFTKMLKKSARNAAAQNIDNSLISTTNSPLYGDNSNENIIQSMLGSEHMITASAKTLNDSNYNRLNNNTKTSTKNPTLIDEKFLEDIKQSLRQTLKDEMKKRNVTRVGVETIYKLLSLTIMEIMKPDGKPNQSLAQDNDSERESASNNENFYLSKALQEVF